MEAFLVLVGIVSVLGLSACLMCLAVVLLCPNEFEEDGQ